LAPRRLRIKILTTRWMTSIFFGASSPVPKIFLLEKTGPALS
jgi:hypothetical protein